MSRKIPPLNALRAFEAAARHLSFTRASEELFVTQAAVSHQIKALEADLGVSLFRRITRGVLLTEAGQTYLPVLRDAFDAIAEATARVRADEESGLLTVTTTPSFAARWLVPRLGGFYADHPEIDVRLYPSIELIDFARDDVDVAVRFGGGDWPGVRAEHLLCLDMFPVCSPALLEGPHPLRTPADLSNHTLLHEDVREDWRRWLLAAGIEGVDFARGPMFHDTSLLLQAAVAGLGVAIAHSALVNDDLAAGRLVRPFETRLATDVGFYVVCPEGTVARPKVRAFCDWLFEAAAKTDDG